MGVRHHHLGRGALTRGRAGVLHHPTAMHGRHQGFTLVEVVVAMFLLSVLVVGGISLTAVVQDQFYRMTLRQKAVFVLHGEMERMAAFLMRTGAAGDDPLVHLRATDLPAEPELTPGGIALSRAIPARDSVLAVAVGPNGQATDSLQVFRDQPFHQLLLDAGVPGAPGDDRALVWLDQGRGLVAHVSYTLIASAGTQVGGPGSQTTLPMDVPAGGCFDTCRLLVVYLTFPFRLPEGVDIDNPPAPPLGGELVPIWGDPDNPNVETYTVATIAAAHR